MKPLLASLFNGILCLALIGVSNLSIAQGNIQADARLFVYETPDQKKYVEFYLSTLSASLSRSLVDGHKGVAVQLICTSNGDITFADKYNLIKSTNTNKDLYHVQRIPVKEGSYTFDITLADHVDSTRQISKSLEIDIPAFTKEITMSSIQLLGNVQSAKEGNEMAKNGLVMEPLKFNFLNLKYDALQAYFEVYRTSDFIEKNYLLRYDIIHMAGNHPDTVLTRYKRRTAVPVDPILIREVNDTTWTSGKYQLAVSLLDYDQNVLAKGQETFILSNPRKSYKQQEITQETIENSFVENLSDEELIYSLKALTPKVDPTMSND